MSVYDPLVDCFGNCEGLYSVGSGRVRCYGTCLDKAERLLKLGSDNESITVMGDEY